MKVYVKGLNACVNRKRDVGRYRKYLQANGHELVSDPEEAEVILLWACAFRQDHRVDSLKKIREMNAYKGELVVCGCLPDIDPEGLAEAHKTGASFSWKNEADYMPRKFGDAVPLDSFDTILGERCIRKNMEVFRKENPNLRVKYTDQFIKLFVSEGCSFECSYCAEIMAFPPYRSFPLDTLQKECRRLMELTGQTKVVLWADSLGDYGKDIGSSLPDLIRELLAFPDIQIGMQHLNPTNFLEYFDELIELVKTGRIWLAGLPIQSGSDRILELMNRKYTRAGLDKIFSSIRSLGLDDVETHVIFGFPGETKADAQQTIDFVLAHRPKYVLASGYMESPNMPAAALPGKVAAEETRRRVLEASKAFNDNGIFCNYDDGSISQEHFSRDLVDLM